MSFFVALLSGYRRFLVYPTKGNPNPARLFSVEDYLDKLERDSRPFAELLCGSQVGRKYLSMGCEWAAYIHTWYVSRRLDISSHYSGGGNTVIRTEYCV